MSITTYPLNGITYDAEDAETYLCTRTSGVYADEDCFDLSITDDLQVTISPGIAWIKNADYTGKSICMDESQVITLSLADSSKPRTDRIVLRFDKANNISTLEYVEGKASSSYPAPDITQTELLYELGLYTIYVPAGATAITASNITDTRLDESVCGLMSDGVTSIPTATLQAQAEELIEDLQDAIDGVESGSDLMLKTTYDTDNDGVVDHAELADTATSADAATALATAQSIGDATFDGTAGISLDDIGAAAAAAFGYATFSYSITGSSTAQTVASFTAEVGYMYLILVHTRVQSNSVGTVGVACTGGLTRIMNMRYDTTPSNYPVYDNVWIYRPGSEATVSVTVTSSLSVTVDGVVKLMRFPYVTSLTLDS